MVNLMGVTPDRTPGPALEEEVQLEDRTADGNPAVNGAIRYVAGDIVAKVPSGVVSLTAGGSGLTEPAHENLDTLLHDLVESNYEEFVYSGFKVIQITIWTSSAKTLKIREEIFTYSGFKVATQTIIQYDGAGVEVQRMTGTYTYAGFIVANIDWVRT